jgi:hypothetical protein
VPAVTDPSPDHGYHPQAMHLIILLTIGLGATLLVARAIATPGPILREELSLPYALLAGIGIGVFGALVYVSTQTDLIPDDLEASVLPFVLIGVSAVLLVGVGYRTLRP